MSYLGRIAGRLSGKGGAPAPALRSQSPLVQYDQRLATPEGAQIPRLDALDPGDSLEASSATEGDIEAGFDTASLAAPARAGSAVVAAVPPSAHVASRGTLPLAFDTMGAPLPSKPPVEDRPASRETTAQAHPSDARPDSAHAARAKQDPSVTTSATPRAEHATPAARSDRAAKPTEPRSEPSQAAAARALHEALARVDAWMRAPAERRAETPEPEAPHPSRAAASATLPASAPTAHTRRMPAPPAQTAAPEAPRLTIGHIDVEVVTPPEPHRLERREARAPGRVAQLAERSGSVFAPRHALLFGLRQR